MMKAHIEEMFAVCVNGDRPDLLDRFIDPAVVMYPSTPVGLADTKGIEELRQVFVGVHRVFPDLRVTIEDMLAEGDRVAVRWLAEGTHSSEWVGVPATGRVVRMGGTDIYRFEDGLIREWWRNEDMWALVEQLRAAAAPPALEAL
ncbi:MAG TPA: ester cyclase [Acidimicrobiales bacterium]|jgi:steroid delta-isomerase-like uncharacterized protein|nr:ester cyclase [Acidimicrobiales bacterium]